jgi:serine/threonine protein kinase
MTPERWEEIEAVFQSALTHEAHERSTFVDRECAGNEALRAEVAALLSAEQESRDFLNCSALEITAGQLAQRRAQSVAGRIIGNYRLEQALGAGGMGEVYLAIDQRTDRKVALKLLPDYFNNDPQRVHRFKQEAKAVLALNHPQIVTIYEVGEVDGLSFIASEFIEGETLRQILAHRKLSPREALDLVTQIAGALAAAHDAGVVHRDIKPENIMLRPDGYLKVLDFGVAKLNGTVASLAANPNTTSPGMLIGTAQYMSPEQARGLNVDGRSDLWSLGVVLYEMLTGQAPFAGATASDCIAAILEREPAPVQSYAPGIPAGLSWCIRRLLRKHRDERYQSARELLGDLRELQQELDIPATRHHPSNADRAAEHPDRLGAKAQKSQGATKHFVRYMWAGVGVLAIALVVIAAVKYLQPTNQKIDSLAVSQFRIPG